MSRRLIEEWLPIAELSEESIRERRSMTALPPIYYLHVWWARRPLVAARAAVLGSLLPADADKKRFLHALGIHGDPVKTKQRLAEAKRTGENLGLNPYGYPRAFSYSPSAEERDWLIYEAKRAGVDMPTVLDPTAGGGSIPFEAERLGLDTFANDLNPVAITILHATLSAPLHGEHVFREYKRLAKQFIEKALPLYAGIFPAESLGTQILGYLFARTIRCPYCGGLIPLSPNWRLAPDGTGVRVVPHDRPSEVERVCSFEIVHSVKAQSEGTVDSGRATCPFPDCGRVIDGEAVKSIARQGGMGEQLYAVVYKKRIQTVTRSGKPGREKWERGYRAPRPEDDVFDTVKARLAEKLPQWEAQDIVPTEEYGDMFSDRSKIYGVNYWRDLFSPRQLYCHCTSVEVFRYLLKEEQEKKNFGNAQKSAFVYLALALDKLADYNSRCAVWDITTYRIRHTFSLHGFPLRWSYAEMAPLISGLGYDWAIEQTGKCLAELIGLLRPDVDAKSLKTETAHTQSLLPSTAFTPPPVTITCKPGDNLDHIADQSIDAVVMDPPYYDNVMYAELSDFFYVWLKRTAGYVYPQLFTRKLTDKESEAVANPAKFKGQKKPKELAFAHYRNRMAAIFAECRRVLKQDGVLMLMFTHKATDAWDALAKGLMDAGYVITASWPVNTEAEGSLHIKDKAAANSTIFLVCRPRPAGERGEIVFWEDLEPQVTQAVLERVETFRAAGISGIDLYLACFGPALEVFSRHWPVKRGTPRQQPRGKPGTQSSLLEPDFDPYATTPEDVLTTARTAVKGWIIRQIVQSERQTQLDPLLEWFVLAWHTFRAPQFAYDEALNLARVVGLDMDTDIIGVIAGKKASEVVLWDSSTRAARASLGASGGARSMLDALHHAAHAARSRTLDAATEMIRHHGLDKSPEFMDGLKALLEVLPVSRSFGGREGADMPAASDFEALENLRRLLFAEKVKAPQQLSLLETAL
ncbi:DUF1156 domain-containing protein [Desulfovibrio sp. ZJ369]|uniref:DUF1156 domain-containing protein n=1 Tax=Desulfovibrio sp. ZJ369 TaxID=2709793 RepID=UPI0013EDE5C0|nr:DUF1156 domain-containing protein [Desulfovibrio sp. ZJ369]